MKKICIATHGRLAEGFVSAMGIIVGEKAKVDFLNAYLGDVSFPQQLEMYFKTCELKDEIYFLTDLFGGSVNQAVMKYLVQFSNLHIITGINLPLVLEFVLNEKFDEESIRMMVEQAKVQIQYVNDVLQVNTDDDFDF